MNWTGAQRWLACTWGICGHSNAISVRFWHLFRVLNVGQCRVVAAATSERRNWTEEELEGRMCVPDTDHWHYHALEHWHCNTIGSGIGTGVAVATDIGLAPVLKWSWKWDRITLSTERQHLFNGVTPIRVCQSEIRKMQTRSFGHLYWDWLSAYSVVRELSVSGCLTTRPGLCDSELANSSPSFAFLFESMYLEKEPHATPLLRWARLWSVGK